MKTAVEWYDTQLKELDYKLQSGLINWTQCKGLMVEAREQAKKMHQEQIVNAHYQGYRSSIGTTEISEQYYNETFKSK